MEISPKILWLETALYNSAPKFIRSRYDTYDITGLILLSLGAEIPINTRCPTQLRAFYYPLTANYRQRTVLTPTGYALLRLSGSLSHVLREANTLLLQYNIILQGK